MRNPERIEKILNILKRVWTTYPDLRFGQLVENIFGEVIELYWIEDDEFELLLLEYEKRLKGEEE